MENGIMENGKGRGEGEKSGEWKILSMNRAPYFKNPTLNLIFKASDAGSLEALASFYWVSCLRMARICVSLTSRLATLRMAT